VAWTKEGKSEMAATTGTAKADTIAGPGDNDFVESGSWA